ncbi:type VI secretion system tip protein TssI/VgrG [Sorangium sp. So ce429]
MTFAPKPPGQPDQRDEANASEPLQPRPQRRAGASSSTLRLPKAAPIQVEVASGDALDIRQFSVHERLSSLFAISLIAVSENTDITFDNVVGKPATFTVHSGLHTRRWSGICNHLLQIRVEEGAPSTPTLATYELSIVPTLWLLTQRRNYRMFQQESELDIARMLLEEWSIERDERLTETYKPRKYRVQYAESDYTFMCRMLEDAGITFYFENQQGETKLVLADAPQSNPLRSPKIAYRDNPMTVPDEEHVTGVRIGQRVRPGKYTIRDHDYRLAPSYRLMKTAEALQGGIEAQLERYHYTPGAFLFRSEKGESTPVADDRGKTRTDEQEGDAVARKRLDAKRATAKVCTFETNAHDLAPGMVISMQDHPKSELGSGKKLLLRESSLSGTESGEWSHHCEAVSGEVPYRPALTTPKPKVNGVESATIVGAPGEEIHCDEFGRVRVHFHWDRESQMDDGSSCWIHVSQPWGGAGFGGMNLPRVGQEVLVDFLGGDPDRPVIVGRVYTNLQRVPYKLPQNKTQSGWRSNSTGKTGGYNELMFEDARGKELINIQAERDLSELVKHDATHVVRNNQSTTVWKNDASLVGVRHSLTIAQPGGGEPAPGPTSVTMTHEKITLTTGKATITIDGGKITLDANESITLESRGKISIHAATGIQMVADDGDTVIKGDPKVKINCSG